MILRTLTLENFGVYAGSQSLELDSETGGPITLIGGQNGEGKTTILEAILHVLYGPHAGPIIGRAGGYERYLRSTINHGADSKRGASIDLEFETIQDGTEVEICVRRSWQVEQGQVREQLTVSLDGVFDRGLTESWADFVETLVPRGVAPLFFFDGEQIEALADLDGAAATIRAAVGSLLGLDLVDQLKSDLLALQRRHAPSAASGDLKKELEDAEREASRSEEDLLVIRNGLAAARTALDQSEGRLRKAIDRFKREGGDLYESRVAIEEELASCKRKVASAREDLREIAAGDASLLLARGLVERLTDQAKYEDEGALSAEMDRVLAARDDLFLSWLKASNESASKGAAEWLASDRESRGKQVPSAIVGLDRSGLQYLLGLRTQGIARVEDSIKVALQNLTDAVSAAEESERRLARVPSSGAINQALEERDQALCDREESSKAKERLEADHEQAARERERRYEARDKVLRRVAELEIAEGDSRRLMEHSEKSRQTLSRLRERSVALHMARIEGLIMESLDELLRKDRLIESVRIDPKSFQLELFGPDRRPISPNDLSAGERQLTALSLLWGLARAADRPLPTELPSVWRASASTSVSVDNTII